MIGGEIPVKPHFEYRIHDIEFPLVALYQFLFNKRGMQAVDVGLGAECKPIKNIFGCKSRMNALTDGAKEIHLIRTQILDLLHIESHILADCLFQGLFNILICHAVIAAEHYIPCHLLDVGRVILDRCADSGSLIGGNGNTPLVELLTDKRHPV